MSLPDLNTDEGRAAYRAELRRVGLPLRLSGFGLIIAGSLLVYGMSQGWFVLPQAMTVVGYGALAAGWACVIAAIYIRTRHHKRRLAEGL